MGKKTETKSKPKSPKSKSKPTKEVKPISPKKEVKEQFTKLFLEYYLGWHDPQCFGNATMSYLLAKGYDVEQYNELSRPMVYEEEEAINAEDCETGEVGLAIVKRKVYHPTYSTARNEGWRLMTNDYTRKLKDKMLSERFKDPNHAKNRHQQLADQNKNLVVATQANRDILKMTAGLEDKSSINIPQLEALTAKIGGILKPSK